MKKFVFFMMANTIMAINAFAQSSGKHVVRPVKEQDKPIVHNKPTFIVNHLQYTKINSKGVSIATNPNSKPEGALVIPESVKYNGKTYKVIGIGKSAFYECRAITSITIPNSVTSIGERAFFGCSGMTDIIIPNSVTSIGNYAFDCCVNLANIIIPNSVTTIGSNVFSNCSSLTKIVVDSNNPKYDSRNNCNAVIETGTNKLIIGCINTVIPNNVTSIGSYAFNYCPMTSVVIPNNVTIIGNGAFKSSKLTNITLPNSVSTIGKSAFAHCYGLTSVSIPNSVTDIRDYAFYYTHLANVLIPNSVRIIGEGAFKGCKLTSITIPNSVTTIGKEAFSECSDLSTISVESNNKNYDSRNKCNAIIETATNTLIQGCKNTTIPQNVTRIGDYAFSCCSGLTNIILPNSVTTMGECVFMNCNNLISVTIPNSVTAIGGFAFANCYHLCNLSIPNSLLKKIHKNVFSQCDKLISVIVRYPDGTEKKMSFNDVCYGSNK